jgi:alkanesulfonate monooxygenase
MTHPTRTAAIRTEERVSEVSWFAPICDDDCEYLGVTDPFFKSSFSHASDVLSTADRLGYNNILCPSSYQVGQDTLSFAAAVAPMTKSISLLAAIRCGEVQPLMLARALTTIDHILEGRFTINIISSEMPGESLDSRARYQRSKEVVAILKQCWTQEVVNFEGDFYSFKDVNTRPAIPYQQNGGPLLYFGGYSPDALDLCAEHCDVYLMWPETRPRLAELMDEMSERASGYNRKVDFGLRVHVVVRETESEARAAAEKLVSRLEDTRGKEIRERALDAHSLGVSRQTEMRGIADSQGYIEDHLWTGVGRARSGCGAALVGDPDQIYNEIQKYMDMGIRAFIFSGYPQRSECELFARYVLPRLPRARLSTVQGRTPTTTPLTPLAAGERI